MIDLKYRFATQEDVPLLAKMNQQLIRNEGHRNKMTLPELQDRMSGWLQGEYTAVIFGAGGNVLIEIGKNEEVYMTGPVEGVFEGHFLADLKEKILKV